jgi:cytochrome c-type biogenesis protein CcmH
MKMIDLEYKVTGHRTYFFVRIIVLVILCLSILSSNVTAQSGNPPSDDEINAIAKELYCPVCENTPLDVCPTAACAQWRELIKEKLVAGWSKDQIKQYFVDQYGDRVLAEPPRRGLNWLVYVLPPLFFLGGIVIVYRNLRNIKSKKQTSNPEKSLENDPYYKEVEEALNLLNKKDEGE